MEPGGFTADTLAQLARLQSALLLGEGFSLHVVAGRAPEQVREAVRPLAPDARWLRWERIGTSDAAQAEALLRSLTIAFEAPVDGDAALLVLDATSGPDDGWRHIFRRLNERRNEVIRAFPHPLLIALTPERERHLAGEAPDLWSVRGVVVRVEALLSAVQRYGVLVRLLPGQVFEILMRLGAPVAHFPAGTPAEWALAIAQWVDLQPAEVQQRMDDLLRRMAPGLFRG